MSTILGLPAHPLVVHAAVILVPLAVVGLVAVGWRAEWRRVYLPPVAALAWGGWLFAQVASSSGESLEGQLRAAARSAGNAVPRFGEHPELGESAATMAFLFAVAASALWAADRWGGRYRLPSWAPMAAYVGASVVGLAALGWMFQAGHTGAELVWKSAAAVR